MPDDLAEIEVQVQKRMDEHFQLLEEDSDYRKRCKEKKYSEQKPILPIGAW